MTRPTAFITGASSGIGAAFARRLAAERYDLILHGRREHLLVALCNELGAAHGIRAEYLLAELSSPEGIELTRQHLLRAGRLTLLVNNAGSGSTRLFHEEDLADQAGMVTTHVLAALHLCHAAIPILKRNGGGAIINVSSIASYTPGKRAATYCAVKSFLTTFSEALHLELYGSGVKVQALCPGYTTTDFHSRLHMEIRPSVRKIFMTPEAVVDQSLRDLERGRVVCVPGWRFRAVRLAALHMPRGMYYMVARRFGDRTRGA